MISLSLHALAASSAQKVGHGIVCDVSRIGRIFFLTHLLTYLLTSIYGVGAVNCNTNVEAFRLTPTGVSDTDHAVFRQSIEWAAIVLVALTLLGRLSDLLRTIHRATTHIHWKAEVAWALPTHCGCRSMRRDHTSKKSAEILVQAAQKDSAAAELQDAYDETTDTLCVAHCVSSSFSFSMI